MISQHSDQPGFGRPGAGQPGTGQPAGGEATAGQPGAGEAAGVAPAASPQAEAQATGGLRSPSGGSNRAALARLLVAVAAIVGLAAVVHNGLIYLVIILALVVMVMLHELGHFATAKWSGMKVTEYFLGFGPRLWSIRRGETEYGVKAIPAGGYVRIVGMTSAEEIDPTDEPRAYRQASFPRRLLVAVAGSAMHFVMAFILLWAMFAFTGVPTSHVDRTIEGVPPLSGVTSPARAAGLRTGDTVLAIDGKKITSGSQLVSTVEGDTGKKLRITVRRDGVTSTVTATPVDGRKVVIDGQPAKTGSKPVGFLGVDLGATTVYQTTGVTDSLGRGVTGLGSMTGQTFSGIARVFSLHGLSSFFHDVATAGHHPTTAASSSGAAPSSAGPSGSSGSSGQILSIWGAIDLAAQAAHQSLYEVLYILVAINLFIGIINLFPMLPLDGGHVLIAVYERVRSRRGRRYRADVAKLMPVAYLFLAFMLVIGLSALYANIVAPPTLGG